MQEDLHGTLFLDKLLCFVGIFWCCNKLKKKLKLPKTVYKKSQKDWDKEKTQ